MKIHDKTKLWLAHPRRTRFDDVVFLPGIPQENITTSRLNKWTGWRLTPSQELSRCNAWREYLEYYVTDPRKPQEAHWLYSFFASIIQQPMNKTRSAVVIIGDENIAKSTFMDYYGKILGEQYLAVSDAIKIHGRFNDHLETVLLLHSEEAIFGGDKRHKSTIKSLISDKRQTFEMKYGDVFSAPNFTRVIYTSNEEHAAPIALGDARHTVFNMRLAKRVPPRELVGRVFDESLNGGPEALMQFLLEYKYDPMILMQRIETRAHAEVAIYSFDTFENYWFEKLMEGELLHHTLRWAQGRVNKVPPSEREEITKQTWCDVVSYDALYADYLIWQQASNNRQNMSKTIFGKKLRRYIPMAMETRVYYTNSSVFGAPMPAQSLKTGHHYCFIGFPTLEQAREIFDTVSKSETVWPVREPEDLLTEN